MKPVCLGLALTLGIVAAVAAQPRAADVQQWQQQYDRAVLDQAGQLAASGRAEDLYLAARLTTATGIDSTSGVQDSEIQHSREQWLQQAFAAPGDSVIVARAALGRCGSQDECARARARWQALGVADAAAWLVPNAAGEISEAAWASAAAADRYLSDYELELPALLRASADWTLPAPPAGIAGFPADVAVSGRDILAVTTVATLAATVDVPMATSKQCKAATAPQRLQQCRSILETMADSPTLAQASVGTALRFKLATDVADAQHWQQRRRELAWVSEQGAPLIEQQPVYDYVLRASQQGESATMRALLVEAGIAPAPAAHWQPYSAQLVGK